MVRTENSSYAVSTQIGDMEAVLLQSYRDAAEEDQIVFAAVVDPEFANQAASLAKSQGATQVAHFGNSVITSY